MKTTRLSSFRFHTSAFAALALAACSADSSSSTSSQPASKPSTTTSQPASTTSQPVLEAEPFPMHFDSTTMVIKGKTFSVEIAATPEQCARGLMYRDSLPDDHGMIFFLPKEDLISFWMHNTRIPLDIIFLDKNGKVLDIFNRKPLDDTGTGPSSPALYVVELNLGMANKLMLKKGDTVEIPKIPVKN